MCDFIKNLIFRQDILSEIGTLMIIYFIADVETYCGINVWVIRRKDWAVCLLRHTTTLGNEYTLVTHKKIFIYIYTTFMIQNTYVKYCHGLSVLAWRTMPSVLAWRTMPSCEVLSWAISVSMAYHTLSVSMAYHALM